MKVQFTDRELQFDSDGFLLWDTSGNRALKFRLIDAEEGTISQPETTLRFAFVSFPLLQRWPNGVSIRLGKKELEFDNRGKLKNSADISGEPCSFSSGTIPAQGGAGEDDVVLAFYPTRNFPTIVPLENL